LNSNKSSGLFFLLIILINNENIVEEEVEKKTVSSTARFNNAGQIGPDVLVVGDAGYDCGPAWPRM
jgi:hypothetical protein